jgi:hypothetical protein
MPAVACKTLYPAAERAERSYLAVVYRVEPGAAPEPIADVRQGPSFPTVVTTWKTATVRPPDACANDAPTCAPWLTEIERALTEHKFAIVSWSAVREYERSKQVPTHVAAAELQADVVFVVNELAGEAIPLGKEPHETFGIYATDEAGRERRPLPDHRATVDAAAGFAKHQVKGLRDELAKTPTHLTATLDVTAVDAKSGVPVWFYRRREVKPLAVSVERDFLIANEGESWWPTYPRGADDRSASSKSSATSVAEQSRALSRAVVSDFVARVGGG